jgi:uncharacterized protein (TIGR00299 family) protein
MTRWAYLDCVAGVAGDMLLGALLDVGGDRDRLDTVPARLGLDGIEISVHDAERHALRAVAVDVRATNGHPTRTWREIRDLLERSAFDARIRSRSLEVFGRLVEAEARVHGIGRDDVHLHEIGTADTLVDVCGAFELLDSLGVDRVACATLPLGRGLIRTAHGVLPLPAPATLELLHGVPVVGVDDDFELVTPTGAALATTLVECWGALPPMTIERVGCGAGSRDLSGRPNVLRVLLGASDTSPSTAEVALLETNVDDMIPELVPDAVERCFAAGALDVWVTPVLMKKGRPGIVLSALAPWSQESAVATAIIEETTAIGVRVARLGRHELDREERVVEVEGHPIRVKVGWLEGRIVNVAPEHDDCAAVARATQRSVKEVWASALRTLDPA